MARQIDILSASSGIHYLEFGMNEDELAGFAIQLWITKYGARAVDWMQSIGMGFITFMGGNLWIHNSDTARRCNLFGEQKECIVGVVSNEEPTKVKLFDSISIHSDGQWEVSEVIIPKNLNYPDGMYSKITKELFKKRGGEWRARFLRNMKTGQTATSVIDTLSGEPLNGYECYMVLKNVNNPNGVQVKLFKVDVNCSSSRV